jgi:hypothetical protein
MGVSFHLTSAGRKICRASDRYVRSHTKFHQYFLFCNFFSFVWKRKTRVVQGFGAFPSLSRIPEKSQEKVGKEVSLDKVGPPWVTSHLTLKAYESDMRASILKITEVWTHMRFPCNTPKLGIIFLLCRLVSAIA